MYTNVLCSVLHYCNHRAFESLGVRAQKSEILRIFDKLDLEDIGMVAHEDIVGKVFPDAAVKGRGAELDVRADSDIRVALRKRLDLLEEVVSQLKTIESKTEYVVLSCYYLIIFLLLSILQSF